MKPLMIKVVCLFLIVLTGGLISACRPDVQSDGVFTDRHPKTHIESASIDASENIILTRSTPGIGGERTAASGEEDVMTKLAGMKETRHFADAIRRAGLDHALSGKGPFTVFVPVDKAFDNLPSTFKKILTSENLDVGNKERLINILHYHVMLRQFQIKDMYNHSRRPTAKGDMVSFSREPSVTKILGVRRMNDAIIIRENINCSNGVIHLVDQVLLPGDTDYRDKKKDLLKR